MNYYVKVCPKCNAINHPSMTYCVKCGTDLPTLKQESDTKPIAPPAYAQEQHQPQPPSQQNHNDGPTSDTPLNCTIVDIHMPFLSMVGFMVKWAIAAIPALLILFILGIFVFSVLTAIRH